MSKSMTMPIAKAQVLADESGIEELVEAITQAVLAGWEVVDFTETEEGNVLVTPHTGVMVAWMLDDYAAEKLHVEGGEQDLHVTLNYLGDVSDLTFEQQRLLVGVVSEVLEGRQELYGVVTGTDTFPAGDDGTVPWHATVDVPGLSELRQDLHTALVEAGLPAHDDYDPYTPHITLAYLPEGQEPPQVTVEPMRIRLDTITVAMAGSRRDLQLQPIPWDSDEWKEREDWYIEVLGADPSGEYPAYEEMTAYRPFVKSVVEAPKRFTLGPWYIPDMEDAHGEWTDADELQAALWRYVDAGYRGIHLQHMPDVVAGRWVEIMSLPWPTTVPVIDVNGAVVAHEYPAGTVMLGVIWDPWAWELVVEGKISGYSIGGNAARTDENPPGPDDHNERVSDDD